MMDAITVGNGLLSVGIAVLAVWENLRARGKEEGPHRGWSAAGCGIRVLMLALYLDRIGMLIIEGIVPDSVLGGTNVSGAGESVLYLVAVLLSKSLLSGIFLAKKYLLDEAWGDGLSVCGDAGESGIRDMNVEGLLTGAAVFFLCLLFLGNRGGLWRQLAEGLLCVCAYGLLAGALRHFERRAAEGERLRQNERQARKEAAYAHSLENNYQRMRELWHDLKNHIGLLKHFVKEKDYGKVEEYLQVFGEEVDTIVLPVKSGNFYLDAVLADKLDLARKAGISMQLELSRLSCEIPLRPDEVCSVFGNLLDNAIEACKEVGQGAWIRLRLWEKEDDILLSVRNAAVHRVEDGDIRKSRKTDRDNLVGHGIGLRSVERILHSHGGELALSVSGGEAAGKSAKGDIGSGMRGAADGRCQFTAAVRLPKVT